MEKLKHLVFEFKGPKDFELSSRSEIFLVINDVITDIPIISLFMKKPSIDYSDISGYSILELVKNNKLVIDETTTLDIQFIDKTSGNKFHISKIRRPFMYENDMPIGVQKRMEYVDILLSGINTSPMLSEEGILSQSIPVGIETPAAIAPVLGGNEWNAYRTSLLDNGFIESVHGNYRFFCKEDQIAFYLLVDNNFIDVDLFEEGDENYSFRYDDTEFELNYKNNKLTIKQIVI